MGIVEGLPDQYFLYHVATDKTEKLLMTNTDLEFTKRMKDNYLDRISKNEYAAGTIEIKLNG